MHERQASRWGGFWVLVLPGVAACTESVDSTDIRTSGIYPEIRISAEGSGDTLVEVQLKVGGRNSNTFLELKGEDRLEATADGETKVLRRAGTARYNTSFDVDDAGTQFEVAFFRGTEDENAPRSRAVLPEPFTLSIGVTEVSRTLNPVPFSWEPEVDDGEMYWFIEGPCILDEDGTTPDDGEHLIAADQVESFMNDANETCTVELAVSRLAEGYIDPAFTEGGEIVAAQNRRATFVSLP
jgi:hypothetical protein